MSGERVAGLEGRADRRQPESAADQEFRGSAVAGEAAGPGSPPMPASLPVSGGDAGRPAGGKGKPGLRLLVYLALVVLMGNLSAVVGKILRPEIPYLDLEYLIVGGVTAFMIAALLGAREVYLARRQRTDETLKASEARYRAMLATTMDGFWIIDLKGRFLDVNDATCRHLGYTREELLGGMRIRDIEAVETPEEIAACIRKAREAGRVRFETRHRKKDGTLVDTEVSVHSTEAVGGRCFTFIRDITDRKKAEEELRHLHADLERKVRERTAALQASNEQLVEAQRQQRALLDAIPDIAWLKDRESRLIAVNRSYGEVCGIDPADLIGKTDLDAWPRELAEKYMADDRRVVESGRMARLEEKTLGRGGEGAWVDTFKVPFFNEGGEVIGTVGIARDVTERKRMEEALCRSHEELEEKVRERTAELAQANEALRETTRTLEELVEAAPVGISVLDPEGKVLLWNSAMEKIQGWTEEEVRGKLLPAVTMGQEGAKEGLERLLAGERQAGVELRRVRKDGRPINVLLWTAPLWEASGRLKSIVIIFLDITPLKEMERIALAQEKLASLGHVAAGVAHEIRNPLSGLNIHLSALERTLEEAEGLEPEIRETTQTILRMASSASGKIEGVVRRVMDLANPAPPKMGPTSVNACMRETLHLSRVTLRKAGVRLTETLSSGLPKVRGDACLLERVLLNLLTNAAQAMEGQAKEKRIEVSSGFADGHVTVSVADSGPGVPPHLREKIFEPFFTTRKEGTGIGLSLSHRIVADHGGILTVGTSRLGGALFTIGLPAGDRETNGIAP